MKPIRRVAVLGAGTMGSRIAGHFANAGIPALLLDLDLAAATRGIESALKQKPTGLFTPAAATLIAPGSFDSDMAKIAGCDWIIEAVTENLAIKRALYDRVEKARAPGSIVSTNTSGIPLSAISEAFSPDLRQHFLGTHFFNPPRYLHLAEIIPGASTLPEVLNFVSNFCDLKFGKGVVPCKDTPNFIANRIGTFFGSTIQKLTLEDDFTIEEVDALTGTLIGLPKSASYRLLDIVGLDIWAHVTNNLHDAVPDDPYRDRFVMQPFLQELIERKWLGEKTGQGLYKRVGKGDNKEIHAIDRKTFDYHPAQKPRFASVDAARNIENLPGRLRAMVAAQDRAGAFLWKLFSDLFIYSATMAPEISGRIVEIDRAMRWGYANALGPFELWDALGFEETARRMEREGRALPPVVEKMLSSGAKSFYEPADADGEPRTRYFDLTATEYRDLETRPGILVLSELKRARGTVKKNAGASLIDLGDGVLGVEFHGKMNAIGDDLVAMIHAGIDETSRNFEAMVIGNQGENFSVGANLMLVLLAAQEEEWDELNAAINRFQQVNMAIKYAPKPVVIAPFGMTLGGGCEIALHGARVQASAELYMGLVEVGVGLIPGGGGCKEMLLRLNDAKAAFELIGYAKVSTSAADARGLGLLRQADEVSMNPERLIGDAKALALSLASRYSPGAPRADIRVGGGDTFALLKIGIWMARQGNYITEYDTVVGEKLAYVLSGGRGTGEQTVSEQYLLDLEREAFLSLCGRVETRQRMQHMLKTGKPLRN
ncbi:MAG: 3-hydroxyacyl-CoA dehydrogenase/enoyl-CoA hydratase family protein [Acidobacteriota bacterium]|nr:3-hydroxyacyl-CoA dehydrogenase/enoyl-CoA hydratase family protein [Acidobacteriota bacterium]